MFIRKMIHFKCRNSKYPLSNMARFIVEDNQVDWSVKYDGYNPPNYEAPSLANKPWADPCIDDNNFKPLWNKLDGKVNRKSHEAPYEIHERRPRNPHGRTGLIGRGLLGRWGPNHAADPIVTRWKRSGDRKILNSSTNKPILQFCAIQRRDCNEWAIPGGMVDPGENVSETLKREFMEEALNSLQNDADQVQRDKAMLENIFKTGAAIYKGYVDDPRNTDNAWMETVAINFHDESGTEIGKFALKAGDDAKNVRWIDIDSKLELYASHSDFVKEVAIALKAHW